MAIAMATFSLRPFLSPRAARALICAAAFQVLSSAAPALAQSPNEKAAAAAEAARERLEIAALTDKIAITPDFSGADITIFGAIDGVDQATLAARGYDIVVSLAGPDRPLTVRRKERTLGIWMTRRSMDFEPVPMSYSLSSTRPIELVAPKTVLSAEDIGVDRMRLVPTGFVGQGGDVGEFRQALLALKRASGLYQEDMHGVSFVASSLFKASIRLPASIPVGRHRVAAYLFRDGNLVSQRQLELDVVKTGIEEYLNEMAHERSLLYGLMAVALAGVTGWLASVIFRRD